MRANERASDRGSGEAARSGFVKREKSMPTLSHSPSPPPPSLDLTFSRFRTSFEGAFFSSISIDRGLTCALLAC